MSFVEKLLHSFPVPSSIGMSAVGLDISDHSVKFLELVRSHGGLRVGRFGTKEIPEGIIMGGTIAKKDALIALLSSLREEHGLSYVRASLPEEPGYIFTTRVPNVTPDEVRSLLQFKLEEHVPIAPAEAVIDYDVIAPSPNEPTMSSQDNVVAVSVFPELIAQDYADLLHASGLSPVSLEIEAQAIARAVVPHKETEGCMVVDIGRMRSGITVVGGGAVRFTTTVETGGDALTHAIKQALPQASEAELLALKNEAGLAYTENSAVQEAMKRFTEALIKDVERYFVYWQSHKDQGTVKLPAHPIKKIYLSGGYANIAGLPEFFEHRLRISTVRANVWTNVLSIEHDVPPVGYGDSLSYASAIGLALHKDNF